MKKAKKLLALVLAMAMAFSLMAVTAAAYDAEEHEHTDACSTETIQPRAAGTTCLYCGRGMSDNGSVPGSGGSVHEFICYNDDCPYYVNSGYKNRATQVAPWI